MRVYLPVDRRGLEHLADTGVVPPGRGYAVTPAFAEAYGSDDVEELEYAAMMGAAEASADVDGHRIVVAADVESTTEVSDEHPAAVTVGAVALADVASIHVGDDTDDQLAWYAPQELAALLD